MNANVSVPRDVGATPLRLAVLFGVVWLLAMLLPVSTASAGDWGGEPPTAPATGTISGIVTNAGGTPLKDIEIIVFYDRTGWGSWTRLYDGIYTDVRGAYRVPNLEPRLYILYFNDAQNEYLTRAWGGAGAVPGELAVPVDVQAGQTASGIDVALPRSGRIDGTVRNSSGQPLANIRVVASRWVRWTDSYASWWSSEELDGVRCFTDQNGHYDLRGLQTGSYRVRFADSAEGDQKDEYLDRYYGGSLEIGEWDEPNNDIAVWEGQTTAGIDQVLPLGGRIRGRLLDAHTGFPLFSAAKSIVVLAFQGDFSSAYQPVVAADGSFDLGPLESGPYVIKAYDTQVRFRDYFYLDKAVLADSLAVSVTQGSVTAVSDIRMLYGNVVQGRATDQSGNGIANMINVSALYWNGAAWVEQTNVYTDSRGCYIIGGLTSGRTYRLKFMEPFGRYLTRYNGSALSISAAADVAFVAGRANVDVSAVLPRNPAPLATALTLTAPTFRYSGSATLSGVLSSFGTGLSGKKVLIERSIDGGKSWPDITTVTTRAGGAWSYVYNPSATYERNQRIRVRYAGTTGAYVAASATANLLATVYLSTPSKSAAIPTAARSFTVSGYLKPKFRSGTYPVRAYFYKKQADDSYAYVKAVSLKATDYSTYSKVSGSTSLPVAGEYSVELVFSGGSKSYKGYSFAATRSPFVFFTVK